MPQEYRQMLIAMSIPQTMEPIICTNHVVWQRKHSITCLFSPSNNHYDSKQ